MMLLNSPLLLLLCLAALERRGSASPQWPELEASSSSSIVWWTPDISAAGVAAPTVSSSTTNFLVLAVSTQGPYTPLPTQSPSAGRSIRVQISTRASTASSVSTTSSQSFSTTSSTSFSPSATTVSEGFTASSSMQSSLTPSQKRNLILILTIGIGTIFAIVGILFTLHLRRRNKGAKIFRRNATPIDDEEIQTWRNQAWRPSTSGSQIVNDRKASLQVEWPEKAPMVPAAVVTKAPNARVGLTDDDIPGQEPFVLPPKRSNSKLTKSRHSRSKSARSSISDRPPTPYQSNENEDAIPPPPRIPERLSGENNHDVARVEGSQWPL